MGNPTGMEGVPDGLVDENKIAAIAGWQKSCANTAVFDFHATP